MIKIMLKLHICDVFLCHCKTSVAQSVLDPVSVSLPNRDGPYQDFQ